MEKSKIYTKSGDAGTTSLVGGQRVPKTHIRLDAYGTVDELNSFVGSLILQVQDPKDLKILSFIQHKLFTIGAYLATDHEHTAPKEAAVIVGTDIVALEERMDDIDSELPAINQFILPGGSESSARAHICRTVCRRAERCIYLVNEMYAVDQSILVFVNRLSDYFFLLARKESAKVGKEIFWKQS